MKNLTNALQSLFLMTLSTQAISQIYVERLLSFDDELAGNLSVVYSLQAETSRLGAYKSPKSPNKTFPEDKLQATDIWHGIWVLQRCCEI